MNASVHMGCSMAQIVSKCHSVTLAFDKGMGAPIGAVVAGSKSFIARYAFQNNFLRRFHELFTLSDVEI